MRGNSIFVLTILLAALFSFGALAEELAGKTADGCSYKVINGQYLTSCPSKKNRAVEVVPVSQAQTRGAHTSQTNPGPVTSYGDVPVHRNYAVSPPSLPPRQPVMAPNQSPSVSSAFENSESHADLDQFEDARRNRLRNKMIDQTYAGLTIGASNVKEANTGSTAGVGLDIGTNIDETFGVEIGYSYANQKLNLGLASRGTVSDGNGAPPLSSSSDSALSTHLFTGEVQAHLTDPLKRLRPYLGAGLGWRSATLSENAGASGSAYATPLAGGSLHQSAFGGLASAGTKLRITRALQLGFAFRYFFPLARQDARLEQPTVAYNSMSPSETRLSPGDDGLTGSSQYQVLGGVQYSF